MATSARTVDPAHPTVDEVDGVTARPDPLLVLRGDGASWGPRLQLAGRRWGPLARELVHRRPLAAGVACVVVLAAVVGAVVLARGTPAPEPLPYTKVRPTTPSGGGPVAGGSVAPASTQGTQPISAAPAGPRGTAAPTIWVDVNGAVTNPGLVPLPDAARLADAIDAAGGLAGDADRDRINLAGRVRDGERIYVPRRGEQAVPTVVAGGDGDGGAPPGAGGASTGRTTTTVPGPIDVNRATAEQLDTLPGVGPSTAAAIVDYRTEHGPFRSVEELEQVRGLGKAKLEQIRPRVRVAP